MLSKNHSENCFGFCHDCDHVHSLPTGNAIELAQELMRDFEKFQRLDFINDESQADPQFGFDQLFPGDRGHMFGILECETESGEQKILRAFSSLAGGIREVPGWVSSMLDPDIFAERVFPGQQQIKAMTVEMNLHGRQTSAGAAIFDERKQFSQNLMREIHDFYEFTNFRGETRPLRDVFLKPESIPGGVGECCAPKLLNHAAKNGLKPLGLAEFYWGGPNSSGRKQPGEFFSCCEDKCQPILGFMLCGLD